MDLVWVECLETSVSLGAYKEKRSKVEAPCKAASWQSGARTLTSQGGGQHGVLQVHVWSDGADQAIIPRAGA